MQTSAGPIAVEQVVVAVGPWIPTLWEMLDLPRPACRWRATEREMWTYWYLQEGEIAVDPSMFVTADGARAPGRCTSTATRRCTTTTARLVTAEQWGVYFKQDKHSVQGGASPLPEGARVRARSLSRPGPSSPASPTSGARRSRTAWRASRAAARCYRQTRSGGVGAFTADNFPVFDHMRPNVFVAADSNHGYKMIAVGREIARVLQGEHSTLLHPFRYERFATGDLHPVSNSPYPWS